MDEDVKKWVQSFRRVLNKMPKSIEVVVNDSDISIWKAGSYSRHMGSTYDHWGMSSNPDIWDDEITNFANKCIIPYSEGQ